MAVELSLEGGRGQGFSPYVECERTQSVELVLINRSPDIVIHGILSRLQILLEELFALFHGDNVSKLYS